MGKQEIGNENRFTGRNDLAHEMGRKRYWYNLLLRYWFNELLFQWSQFIPHNVAYMITKKMISVIAFKCFKKVRGEGNCTIAEDFNIQVGSNPEDYEVQHGGYIYWARKKGGKRILDYCAAMNTREGNTLQEEGKSPSHLWVCSKIRSIFVW